MMERLTTFHFQLACGLFLAQLARWLTGDPIEPIEAALGGWAPG